MVVAKKKQVQKARTTKTPVKRKVSTTSANSSVTESLQFRLMIVCFTLLSVLFMTVAIWRYA